jgi:hypothetical protein
MWDGDLEERSIVNQPHVLSHPGRSPRAAVPVGSKLPEEKRQQATALQRVFMFGCYAMWSA